MRLVKRTTIFLLISLIITTALCSISAAAVEEIVVNSEVEIKTDQASAHQEALKQAFQKAVRKVLGSYIRKSTLLENSKFVSQQLYSKVEGYVKDYQIIAAETKNNHYRIKLKAEVTAAFLDELEEIKVILASQTTNPRLRVILKKEEQNSKPANEFQAFVEQIEANFRPTEFSQQALTYQQSLQSELEKIGFEIAAKNSAADFDILVQADFKVEKVGSKNIAGANLNIQQGKSSLKLYSRESAAEMTSFKVTGKAYARDPAQAAEMAAEKTAQAAAQKLTKSLLPLINFNSGRKKVELSLINADYEKLAVFEAVLSRLAGIKNFNLVKFKDSKADYQLKVLQPTSVLAERFKNEKTLNLKILELGTDYLKLQLN